MKVAVIGAGAAGFFAAIQAASGGAQVVLLEKSNKVLAKVKISGGGRCNVTNSCDDNSVLVLNYPRGSKELAGPFTRFNTTDTRNWFEQRGVRLKTEPDGRVFPVTDSSQTIIDCVVSEADKMGVKIYKEVLVKEFRYLNQQFELDTGTGTINADKLIIATGGNPSASFYKWLVDAGHRLIAPVPSLFTFNMPKGPFNELMGVSVQNARLKIEGSKFVQEGPLLFTHWGVSGPAVLKLSANAARHLAEVNYQFAVLVNFLPALTEDEVRNKILETIEITPKKIIYNSKIFNLPSRLWNRLVELSGIPPDRTWSECGKTLLNKLIHQLTSNRLEVKGKTTFKEEFVTCGGISLKDVNMKTMESKIIPGLYFAGEVLDIDGVTGGFNFQAAWTTGYIAGSSCVK